MSSPERKLSRGIKITPREDRSRYEAEWRGDLAAAEQVGIKPLSVSRGALAVAWRLRRRQFEEVLTGRRGRAE